MFNIEKIWLDDIRPAPDNTYTIVKSVNQAKLIIQLAEKNGSSIFLDLDHDLGDYANDGGDGYELVKWLVSTERFYPIQFHTQNVVGRMNMQALVDRYWK